ncbi:hypothetical protein I546_5056 [Mycobacterium kansasii 732]|nr:hypothetical protein I546_5056 [Mycobacterium kansasii 732]
MRRDALRHRRNAAPPDAFTIRLSRPDSGGGRPAIRLSTSTVSTPSSPTSESTSTTATAARRLVGSVTARRSWPAKCARIFFRNASS